MADKRTKAVAFNLELSDEKKLWKHISRRNFSGYVKKLIAQDIAKKEAQKQKEQPEQEKPDPITPKESALSNTAFQPPKTFINPTLRK